MSSLSMKAFSLVCSLVVGCGSQTHESAIGKTASTANVKQEPKAAARANDDSPREAPKAVEARDCPPGIAQWSAPAPLPEVNVGSAIGVILPESSADAVLCPCSRASPGLASAYWTPSASEIASLEEKLGPAMKKAIEGSSLRKWSSDRYRRQYLGVVRDGQRKLHVNLIPRTWKNSDWHQAVVNVCDGGADYGAAEFDLTTSMVVFTAVNGES